MTRKKKPTTSLVRSSAAEYLTFLAASGTGGVEAVYADENVWLSQKMNGAALRRRLGDAAEPARCYRTPER